MSDSPADQPKQKDRPKRKPKVKHGVMWFLNAALAATTVVVLVVGAAVFYFKSNPLTAPGFVREMIEDRLAEELPQVRVRFNDMRFVLDEGWRPRMNLRDVVVRRPNGREIVRFNELEATFAARPLLDRQIRPRQIALTGIVAKLRRAADGSVSLQAGQAGSPTTEREAATLPALIGQLDGILASPVLNRLTHVELQALTLRYEDARAGRAWTVDGGRLRLDRDGETLALGADLALLSGGAGVATLSANYTSQIGETAADFGVRFEDVAAQDIAAQGPAFAWLDVLRAPISGSVRSGLHEDGSLSPIAATLQIGAGAVQPNAGTTPIPFDGLRSYFSYDPEDRLLRFDELSVSSRWISGQVTGTAALGIEEDTGQLRDLVAQVSLSELSANPADLYPEPVRIAAAEADVRITLNPFRVTVGRAQVQDAGKTLLVDGEVLADPEGWKIALDGRMDALAPPRLLALWPERAAPNTRKWLSENLRAGDVESIDVAIRRGPGRAPQTYLAFDYDGATVRFSKTLPPVTEGSGHFSLADNRLVVALDEGKLAPPQGGTISVTGSSFIIPDVRARGNTPAVVRLETRSSIEAALSFLNIAPLSAMDKANLPVALADGQAQMSGTLALTLEPGTPPQVAFHASGDLLNVRSSVLIKDRALRAERLSLAVDNAALSIRGKGTLDDVGFDMAFDQPLGRGAGPGELEAQIALNAAALETFGVTLPDGAVSGEGSADVAIRLARGAAPEFSLASDLRGIRVSVPQVSWTKPANQSGRLRVAGSLGEVPQIDTLDISGAGLTASGEVRLNTDRTLDRVHFDTLEVGNWLDVPLDLVGRGAGRPVQVVLRGGALDLRRAAFGQGPPTPGAPPMEVTLGRLQITDTIALTDMQGRFATEGGLDGSFRALLNGGAAVEGRVVPQDGRSAVRLISADAGNVLRAANLLKQVQGGALSLILLPVGSGGAFDGRLTIKGITVRDAPAIAALLNAVSVVGLINELNGDGIYFDDVEASFRLTPNQLTLTEASAVGASMGLSMDGTYRLDTQQLGMQGVISPVYLLNGIGSLFTRRGEGLIGFNYTLTGTARAPDVGVNPLSALTPAMFREIFRAPPPELPEVDGVTESVLPEVRREPQRPVARRPEGR